MDYSLALDTYQGPLDKLVELIEEKKLEITELALAEVTGDFLKYVEELQKKENDGVKLAFLADFLVIASKLLLIKSKALLPSLPLTEEEEGDIRDLEARLVIYKEMKRAQQHIKDGWRTVPQMWSREFFMTSEPLFYPPNAVTPNTLHSTLKKMMGELERIMRPVHAVKSEIINLKAKIEEILSRIKEKAISLRTLGKSGGRPELVVLFLAILHLIKDQLVDVEQKGQFDEITIAKRPIAG